MDQNCEPASWIVGDPKTDLLFQIAWLDRLVSASTHGLNLQVTSVVSPVSIGVANDSAALHRCEASFPSTGVFIGFSNLYFSRTFER